MVAGDVKGRAGRDVFLLLGCQFAPVTLEGGCRPLPGGAFLASPQDLSR
jgi:hypothetical protein